MKRLLALAATLAALTTACAETGAQPLGPRPATDRHPPIVARRSPDDVAERVTRSDEIDDLRALVQLRRVPVRHASHGAVHARCRPASARSAVRGTERRGARCEGRDLDQPRHARPRSHDPRPCRHSGSGCRVHRGGDAADRRRQSVAGHLHAHPVRFGRGSRVRGRRYPADELRWLRAGRRAAAGRLRRPVALHPGREPRDRRARLQSRDDAGTADVFEAVVSIEILDEAGRTVASTFTMATCGTGCRGSYTTEILCRNCSRERSASTR